MRFISLFAGIGGIDLGLERAGWECVAQVEIDPYCRAVLAKHWPDVPRFGDIAGVSVHNLPATDALVGGFPCQPVSVAGSRRGHADERWLWPDFFRLVREVRPRWVVAENVPGLRTLGADGVIQDLESCGYAVWPLVVGADDVGAPHRRKRVFVVAHGDGGRCDGGGQPEPSGIEGARGGQPDGRGERGTGTENMADAASMGCNEREPAAPGGSAEWFDLAGSLWPSRPGEAQYEWEPPRLVYSARSGRVRADELENHRKGERGRRGSDADAADDVPEREGRRPEPRLGLLPDGFSRGLAPRDRRAKLKALGNAVVPQCAEMIGRAILHLDYSKSGT